MTASLGRGFQVVTKGRHLALLPVGLSDDFTRRLGRLNIRQVLYDPANDHAALWSALETWTPTPRTPAPPPREANLPEPMVLARRYLAACYARSQLKDQIIPLRIAVIEGMITHLVVQAGNTGVSRPELVNVIKADLKITERDAITIVDDSLKRLAKEGLCIKFDRKKGDPAFRSSGDAAAGQSFDSAIDVLVKGVIDRFVVREQGHSTADVRTTLSNFLKLLVLRRGWDLGAAFAARRTPDNIEIDKLLWSVADLLAPKAIEALGRACRDLLHAPNQAEAAILTDLGRASFALELAIQAPQDTLLHQAILPQRIYLDANVLLPAITTGHPYHDVYLNSIKRLTEAARESAAPVRVVVLAGFLNEVVSHRHLAVQEIDELKEDAMRLLSKEGKIFGNQNINVFIGAYLSLAATNDALTFEQFLRLHAPYENERQLANWLREFDISIVSDPSVGAEDSIFGNVYHHLEVAFADELASGRRKPILLNHDAIQLSALDRDNKQGVRSIFVTADRRLRDCLGASRFGVLTAHFISHVGLTQLIDLLVGSPSGMRALHSLLWTARPSSGIELVRNYLIDASLRNYDAALAMDISRVLEKTTEGISDAAAEQGIILSDDPNHTDRLRVLRILEQFEDGFYNGMREEIEKRRIADGE